eukprot:TRINITY_DN7552_c0_g2_i1.p1 TRINITY_DN7552_c0_g2~~TRINITY_DN7552_c0_g2_i1.p1  ORF type:complete len:389 (-),score=8.07 TRINITY_DN7552_c0_g2_i1:103-1269(-)
MSEPRITRARSRSLGSRQGQEEISAALATFAAGEGKGPGEVQTPLFAPVHGVAPGQSTYATPRSSPDPTTSVISDRDPKFTSGFWDQLFKLLGVQLRMSTSHHPQTDGQSERTIQILEHMLRCSVHHQQDNWEDLLPGLEFAYNNSVSTATGFSPFYLNYGFHPRTACQPFLNTDNPSVNDWLNNMGLAQQIALVHIQQAQDRDSFYSNRGRFPHTFKQDEKVWLSAANIVPPNLVTGSAKSLLHRRLGPFTIEKVISPTAYRLKLPQRMKCHNVFHVSQLFPYFPPSKDFPDRTPVPSSVAEDALDFVSWTVDSILDEQLDRGKTQFLVHWKDRLAYDSSWVPAEILTSEDEKEKIRDFRARRDARAAVLPSSSRGRARTLPGRLRT